MAIDAKQVMWAGVGAGSQGAIAGAIQGSLPQAGVSPNIGTGVVGFALANWGKGAMSDFGLGVLLASIANMIEQPINNLFGKITQQTTTKTTTTPTTTGQGSTSLDAYATSKYGV